MTTVDLSALEQVFAHLPGRHDQDSHGGHGDGPAAWDFISRAEGSFGSVDLSVGAVGDVRLAFDDGVRTTTVDIDGESLAELGDVLERLGAARADIPDDVPSDDLRDEEWFGPEQIHHVELFGSGVITVTFNAEGTDPYGVDLDPGEEDGDTDDVESFLAAVDDVLVELSELTIESSINAPLRAHLSGKHDRKTHGRRRTLRPVEGDGAMGTQVDLNRIHALAETGQRKTPRGVIAPEDRRPWYRIENRADVDGAVEVYLFDEIGGWGVSAADFARDLRAVTASEIDLHVSCEGGAVFDALAIYETLRRHPANITAHVDGIAASSASFVVQAANKIIMAPRSRMMIHNAHGLCVGNEFDMEEMRDLLRDASENIADIYAQHAGGTREHWRAAMRAASGGPDGTWYDAQAAVAAGLADEVQGEVPATANLAVGSVGITPMLATWSPNALSVVADTIENPPPTPVAIPDGARLRSLFDLA